MKRLIVSTAVLMCIMLMTGSFVQLVAQGPTAVGGGSAAAPTKVESGAVQILNCWMSRPGPNTPDYNLQWAPVPGDPSKPTCKDGGNNCKKICEFRSQGTVEPTDYGYKLTVTLDGTEYTRNSGTKVSGDVPQPGTVIGPGECIVRIDLCPGAPELESLQLDFAGLTVAEGGTVTMMIPYIR